MAKKHRQHKRVSVDSRIGLRVGGVVVPYWPAYWGGVTGAGDAHHGHTTTEGANNDSGGYSDAGSGSDSSGSM
jgi:hypothetical protein